MSVAYVDFTPKPNVAKQNVVRDVNPELIQRYLMSIRGFAILKMHLDEAADGLKAQGVPLDAIITELRSTRPG